MELPTNLIYALTVASILMLFAIRHAYELGASWMVSPAVRNWLFANLYPHIIKRGILNPPISWANIITQLLYWIGTVVFNTVGVKTLRDGSARALSVTAFNFIPLLLSDRFALTAGILDLPSRTISQIHKSVGMMTVTQATLHLILQTMSDGLHLNRTNDIFTFLIAISLVVMALFVAPVFRAYLYEVFLWAHRVLTLVTIYAIWKRLGNTIQQTHIFLLVAAGLYLCTMIGRLIRTLYYNFSRRSGWSRAIVTKYGDACKITVKLARKQTFSQGDHVYLWAPAVSFTSMFQSHPYTVAWWDENSDGTSNTISLLVKSQRGFSRNLQTLSSTQGDFLVNVSGPYGKALDTTSYATLVLLATGVGITTLIPLAKTALREKKASRNALQHISIIWQMEQESEEQWVREWMQHMLDDDDHKLLHCYQYVADGLQDESSHPGRTLSYGQRVKKMNCKADVKEVLAKELQKSVGRTLIAVAANNEFRDELRGLSAQFDFHNVEYQELDFQPTDIRNMWTFKRRQQDYKGVI